MNKQKNSKALALVIISIVLTVVAVALFVAAPFYEDMIGGWSFVYQGNMWGMYQYGYAPIGLLTNVGLGLVSLFKYAVWFDDYNGIINIRAIIVDLIIVAFIVLFIIWACGISKNKKKKHIGPLILSIIFFIISVVVFASLFSALDYIYNDTYTYLFDSVLLNTQISMASFVMVSAATGLSGLSCVLFVIGAIVGLADAFKRDAASKDANAQPIGPSAQPAGTRPAQPRPAQPRPAQPRPAQQRPVQPAGTRPAQPTGTRPVQPRTVQPRPAQNNGQTGRVGSTNVGRKPPTK